MQVDRKSPCGIYTSTVVKAIKTITWVSVNASIALYLYKYSRKGYQDFEEFL